MKAAYDFHLHSCLSPCGDIEMTPNNLVNLAKLLELDLIALTDHNTCKNCRAAIKTGESIGLTVIPGMELCTAEEIHIICLLPGLDAAEAFSEEIHRRLPPIQNKPGIFGEQIVMDEQDHQIDVENLLLISATSVTLDEAPALARAHGGICYPAHIDRESFALLSTLGGFPPEPGFTCAELSPRADMAKLQAAYPGLKEALSGIRLMCSSDAHYLENMIPARDTLELPELTAKAVIEVLRH